MKHFDIKKGAWPTNGHPPVQQIAEAIRPRSVALLGTDFPNLRPRFAVQPGDAVTTGQALFHDRRHPDIAFVSPVNGTVTDLSYGPRRTLSACIVEVGKQGSDHPAMPKPDEADDGAIRATLLKRGFWPAFRTRPFGLTPAPTATPSAIFVNATQPSSHAADPALVLEGRQDDFQRGVNTLTELTQGVVHICQSRGPAFGAQSDRVEVAIFSGSHAAGLSGTHIDRLHRVGADRQVWTIGYQDVIAIGHLFLSGRYDADRVVSVTGSAAVNPRLVRSVLGADLASLCENAPVRCLSGDHLSGRDARFLGRFHDQVTLNDPAQSTVPVTWLARMLGTQGALVPSAALENALAPDILPVPLMRALSIGDCEAAERSGCLALVEEDVAMLSRNCTSGADYGALLRQVLDSLKEQAA